MSHVYGYNVRSVEVIKQMSIVLSLWLSSLTKLQNLPIIEQPTPNQHGSILKINH